MMTYNWLCKVYSCCAQLSVGVRSQIELQLLTASVVSQVMDLGIATDKVGQLEERLQSAIKGGADVLITSGAPLSPQLPAHA